MEQSSRQQQRLCFRAYRRHFKTPRLFLVKWSKQEDDSAIRASQKYGRALVYLNASDYVNAAKTAGIMSHYIADVAVFAQVMGSTTD